MLKRKQKDNAASPAAKKPKLDTSMPQADLDFPRGGGTSLTQSEVKQLKTEALQEADDELFEESKSKSKKSKTKTRESETSTKSKLPRIDQLSYKKMTIGTRILGKIVSVQSLALVVSLPNQLYGHIPITNISSQYTALLEKVDEMEEDEEEESEGLIAPIPSLQDLFTSGQFVRTVVSAVGSDISDHTGLSKSRDEIARLSRKVELSLIPERVNAGVQSTDLAVGSTITAAIKSNEDHGYILDLGIPKSSGFLASKDVPKTKAGEPVRFWVGQLVNVIISKVKGNGKTCNVTIDTKRFTTTAVTEITRAEAILPGSLVQCLITAVQPFGINLQVLGYFDGSIDQIHLSPSQKYKVGNKIKARVLYDVPVSPPRFVLATADRITGLDESEQDAAPQNYPVGVTMDNAAITRIDHERGMYLKVDDDLLGFVHISHVSDDHVAALPGGKWRIGSKHLCRVTGFFPFDGLLQLSLKESVLKQTFLRLEDLKVGQVVKGKVKALKDTGLFVSLSDNLDGVVWPKHYADIILKNPARKFQEGASIKARVLAVDIQRKRLSLTCKKTLLDTELPILSQLSDVKVGIVTHAVVFKIKEKSASVEFFGTLQGVLPAVEVSEDRNVKINEALSIGKVVKVKVIAVDRQNERITVSVRQANVAQNISAIESIEVGHILEGSVLEVHKDNAVLSLEPSKARGLLSLDNLANHRKVTSAQIRVALKPGEQLKDLVVVSRNPDKGIVILANKPQDKKSKQTKTSLTMESAQIGQTVIARVMKHLPHAALLKITSSLGAILYRTDVSDDFSKNAELPAIGSTVKGVVVSIDVTLRQLALSTRQSKLDLDKADEITDKEFVTLQDLQPEQALRGFVKQVAQSGLFVLVGRNITARVQIRELFDEYVKDWQTRFSVGQVVAGKVVSMDSEKNQVEFTLRSDHVRRSEAAKAQANVTVGQKVSGSISKIERFGLFVHIDNTKLSGLCHVSEFSDEKNGDYAAALSGFRVGDRVKALVLKVEKSRISLSLKPSHFIAGGGSMDIDEEDGEELGEEAEDEEVSDGEGEPLDHPIDGQEEPNTSEEDEASNDDEPKAMLVDRTPIAALSHLKLASGFSWSVANEPEDIDMLEPPSDDSEGEETHSKKKKRKMIDQDLTADLDKTVPESNSDFERVLLSSYNSSFLWIKYMSFQLQLSEADKAREIARRAIRTINIREEQERLNVWIALLNLENVYGNDEQLNQVFKQAAAANDSKTVHLRLAAIFEESEKYEKADEQYKRACKKFGSSSKVWTLAGAFYFRRGNLEAARDLLKRCILSLDKRKHLKTISKFAQLEYKLGDAERGKTIFEGIVDSHPKRSDLWSVYVDMETARENIQGVRSIFDRLFVLKLTSHKAKFFFKKWLAVEKRIGDEDGEDVVKAKAIEWTRKANESS